MRSVGTPRFWQLYAALPAAVKQNAVKCYQLWRLDPHHPSLRFRLLIGYSNLYTIRIGMQYRALARMDADGITWTWIGTHSDYDRLVG